MCRSRVSSYVKDSAKNLINVIVNLIWTHYCAVQIRVIIVSSIHWYCVSSSSICCSAGDPVFVAYAGLSCKVLTSLLLAAFKDVLSSSGLLLDLFFTQAIIHATISRHVHTRIIQTTPTIIPPTRNDALGSVG